MKALQKVPEGTTVPLFTVKVAYKDHDFFTLPDAMRVATVSGSTLARILHYIGPNPEHAFSCDAVQGLGEQVRAIGELCRAIQEHDLSEVDHDRVLWVLYEILDDMGRRLAAIGLDRDDCPSASLLNQATVTILGAEVVPPLAVASKGGE